ncbi:MAG: hypothetical protein H0X62_01100 [Bacteroidetes bacterium]|nr:hypothetical protein [Bacteroidota bacterium]
MFQVVVLLVFSLFAFSQENMISIRSQYYKASEDSKEAEAFLEKLSSANEHNPLMLGYRGMSELITAKHAYNPYSKMSYFKKGMAFLEKSILLDPGNPELRWLRFSVQTNAPSVLSYSSNIADDKKYIVKVLLKQIRVDDDLQKRIYVFALQSPDFTKEEKEKFKKIN